MASKNSLRDKLDDETLDLSVMQLEEVPVKEIVSFTPGRGERNRNTIFHNSLLSKAGLPKGTTLDLSNNHIQFLPVS